MRINNYYFKVGLFEGFGLVENIFFDDFQKIGLSYGFMMNIFDGD